MTFISKIFIPLAKMVVRLSKFFPAHQARFANFAFRLVVISIHLNKRWRKFIAPYGLYYVKPNGEPVEDKEIDLKDPFKKK